MKDDEGTAALYKVLEVGPDASFAEIRQSYRRLKHLYSGNSIALDALNDELDSEGREAILAEIEKAFKELATRLGESPSADAPPLPSPELREYIASMEAFSGPLLREIREKLGVSLEQLSRVTRVGREHLENIEAENFPALPPAVFLRGYVVTYAQYLRLDGLKAAGDYMARYDRGKDPGRPTDPRSP